MKDTKYSKQIALKSDLPEVGSKWRDKKDHNYQLTVQEGICFTDNTSNLGYNLRIEDFLNDYEELPTSNSQEKEEVQISENLKLTMSCANCSKDFKELDGKFQSDCKCYDSDNYVSFSSHIEKKEVSEVERALEEPKLSIWKDVSELPYYGCRILVKHKHHIQIIPYYYCNGIFTPDNKDFSFEIDNSVIKKFCLFCLVLEKVL
jgi:hypothetical protein